MSVGDPWYITKHGDTAHQSRDCSALDGAEVVGTMTGAEVDGDHVLRRCEMCRYSHVPVLG